MARARLAILAVVASSLAWGTPVAGQASIETRLLRESAAREARGDYDGAEEVLLRLMEADPTSSGGLFALERVLRAGGRSADLLPVVDAFLARAPDSPGVRYLELRVLAELDSLDAMERKAEAWLAREPASEAPYREVARIYESTLGRDQALEVLQRGRDAVGDPAALSLEIGDLLASLGRQDDAVREWARAVGSDGAQATTVGRRVAALDNPDPAVRRALVRLIASEDDPGRRRAAASIAVDLGLEAEGRALSGRVAGELTGRVRSAFLADIARRARDGGMAGLAAWAYGELGDEAAGPAERRQFDQRLAEASLAAGDSVAALEARRRILESYTPGSVDRRRATVDVVRLESARASPVELRAMIADFRESFPRAPELDELASAVAGALMARGDPAGAAAVLEGVDGPRSNMERGYLLMEQGEVALGRQALLMAIPGLTPAEATDVIQFAALLGRLTGEAAVLLADARVLEHRGRGGEAADHMVGGLTVIPPEEVAGLLAEAARMAERADDPARAAGLRRRLLEEHPDATESAEAALALARFTARTASGVPEAIRILEGLIAGRPDAAVVPDARRELERLRGRG